MTDEPIRPSQDITPRPPQIRRDDSWITSLLRPLLITILIGCIVVAFVAFIRHLTPNISLRFTNTLQVLAIGSALIASYTTTLLAGPGQRHRRTAGFRLSELGILLGLTRILVWVTLEGFPDTETLLVKPLEVLFSGSFVIAALLVGGVWAMTVYITSDFLNMALKPDELIELEDISRKGGSDHRIQSDRGAMLVRFISRWTGGAFLLILFTAGSRTGFGANGLFAITQQGLDPLVIGATILYFLLGFVLLTMGRLAVLRAQWRIQGIPSEETIARNWPIYALGVIGMIALIAFVLPLGGTFRLAQAIAFAIDLLYSIVFLILGGVMALLSLLLPLQSSEESTEAAPPIEPPMAAPSQTPVDIPPWIGGAAFWIVMTLILGYAAYLYLQGRGIHVSILLRWFQRLLARWRDLHSAYQDWRSAERVEGDRKEKGESGSRLRRWWERVRLGRLSPEERIRFFYLSLLDQASESGLIRRPGETPFRYAPRLKAGLARTERVEERPQAEEADPLSPESDDAPSPPESEERQARRREEDEAIDELTGEFVHLHFAHRPADPGGIPRLERLWRKVGVALRRLQSPDSPR